jgi:hypothetical protein
LFYDQKELGLENMFDINGAKAILHPDIRQASVSSEACSILADFLFIRVIHSFLTTATFCHLIQERKQELFKHVDDAFVALQKYNFMLTSWYL